MTSVELPIDPDLVINQVFAAGPDEVPQRAVELILTVLDDAARRQALLALLRAAVSEPEAAQVVRGLLSERLLFPVAQRLGGERPELRASMLATAIVGLAVVRYVVGIEPLAAASREQLAAALTPVARHYLVGDWVNSAE